MSALSFVKNLRAKLNYLLCNFHVTVFFNEKMHAESPIISPLMESLNVLNYIS